MEKNAIYAMYELVGPKGAVKIMVDNYDPDDAMGKEDWPHFDCH